MNVVLNAHKRIIFDGEAVTYIKNLQLPENLTRNYCGVSEFLSITAPEVIIDMHKAYIAAGANVIKTHTFGASRMVLSSYGLQNMVSDLNLAAVKCAKKAVLGTGCKIALSIGPGSKLPSFGQISYDEIYKIYCEQIAAVAYDGIDCIIAETCRDIVQMRAVANAVKDINPALPLIISFCVEKNNNIMTGSNIETIATAMSSFDICALGINCSYSPEFLEPAIEELSCCWNGRIFLAPNIEIPSEYHDIAGTFTDSDKFASSMARLIEKYDINFAGGCCGTDVDYIRKLSSFAGKITGSMRSSHTVRSGYVSCLYNTLKLEPQNGVPVLVTEKTNTKSSRLFKNIVNEGNYQEIVSTVIKHSKTAQMIDFSITVSEKNELEDLKQLIPHINNDLFVPLMIDFTETDSIFEMLKHLSGKSIINAISLEDGAKLRKILTYMKKHPAAAICFAADEDGMARTKAHKLKIAERMYKIWVDTYSYPPEDLIMDFLTFSIASGKESRYYAKETLDAIKEFKEKYPKVKTVLGIRNISYGLLPASRKVLDSVYYYMAIDAGVDIIIADPEKIIPLEQISETDYKICHELIYGIKNSLNNFMMHFANMPTGIDDEQISHFSSIEDKLTFKLLKGDKTSIELVVRELLKTRKANEILEKIILPVMSESAQLFYVGKILLPFLLKTAETMKICIAALMPFLKKDAVKGTVVIGTIKNDIHDIGINLTDVIFTGNGYNVINLGAGASVEAIEAAVLKHGADVIGISGQLVNSHEVIKSYLEYFKKAGLIGKKFLLAGNITKDFIAQECNSIIPNRIYYCKDPFDGIKALEGKLPPTNTVKRKLGTALSVFDGSVQADKIGVFNRNVEFSEFEAFLKSVISKLKDVHKQLISEERLQSMLNEMCNTIKPKFVYGFFNVTVKGNDLIVANRKFMSFPVVNNFSLADSFRAKNGAVIPLLIATLGEETSLLINRLYAGRRFADYYFYHYMFTELTTALAEYATNIIKSKITMTGISDVKLKRFSFGAPECPDLLGNEKICKLLNADNIGVTLNESFQILPIYTSCSMLTWHPEFFKS